MYTSTLKKHYLTKHADEYAKLKKEEIEIEEEAGAPVQILKKMRSKRSSSSDSCEVREPSPKA